MKWLALSVLGWVLLPVLALAQEKVELNTVTRVAVNGSTVEITGTQKPNFTTFTMTDPPRLVIDISEAVLKGVPEESRVNNGLITGLRSANYGSDSSSIARILVGYEKDVETDIQVSGNVLLVKVLGAPGPLIAQAGPPPTQPVQPTQPATTQPAPTQPGTEPAQAANGPTAAEAQAAAAQAARAAQQERAAQEKAQAEAAAAAQAELKAQEKARAEAEASAKLAEQERLKQEQAARAEAAKKAEEERRAQLASAAEEKKHQQEVARAEVEARKQAEVEAKKLKLQEARAAAEAQREEEAAEKKRKAEEAEQKRLALLGEKKHQQEVARAEAEARKQAEAQEKQRRAEEAEEKRLAALEQKKHPQQVARAEVEPRHPEPRPPAEPPTTGRRGVLELVGFQQHDGTARVYVRTSEPVSYKVSEGPNEIVLTLENTQVGKGNNTRALDTSFFDTAVARVDPTVGPDRSVRVAIKLKSQVAVQTRQEGTTISLEFPRPSR